jgi:hypothetical protein
MQGPTEEAIRQFQEAIRLKLDYADAHYNLQATSKSPSTSKAKWTRRFASSGKP